MHNALVSLISVFSVNEGLHSKDCKAEKVLKDLLAFYIQNVLKAFFNLFLTKIYFPYNLFPFC